MSAGRELDLAIAERVFGATPDSWPKDWPMGSDDDGCAYPRLPSYSTEIADAWLVVEEMRARGIYIDVEPRCDRWDAVAGWQGEDDEDIWQQAFVTANTAPVVICLATLKALGEPTP